MLELPKHNKNTIEELRKEFLETMDRASYLDVDFMVRFHAGELINELAEQVNRAQPVDRTFADRLCEISRDLRLAVASNGNLPPDVCDVFDRTLQHAADLVKSAGASFTETAERIRLRADAVLLEGSQRAWNST